MTTQKNNNETEILINHYRTIINGFDEEIEVIKKKRNKAHERLKQLQELSASSKPYQIFGITPDVPSEVKESYDINWPASKKIRFILSQSQTALTRRNIISEIEKLEKKKIEN